MTSTLELYRRITLSKDNMEIKTSKGEYKGFPYKKELYLYGTCVWADDFQTDVPDELCIKIFTEQLEEDD